MNTPHNHKYDKDNCQSSDCCCHQHEQHSHEHHHDEEGISWWKPALSMVMLLAGIIFSETGVRWFQNEWVRIVWYAAAWLPTGLGVLMEAIEEAREGDLFSEFLLMTVASIGAFAIGEYPEAVAVMTLYCIGEALQDRAVSRARGNIKSLIALRPDMAVVIRDGASQTVAPEEIKVGETVEVKAGERVPIDGQLNSEAATFDTAALTGESMPRVIERGGEVLAGMIASESTVRIQAIRPASESAVSRILHLVEDATERKAPSELFIRRFAKVYTPIVVGLALLVVILPWLYSMLAPSFNYEFTEWIHRALIFLVISCPCALVISIPLSYFAGIGAASRRGILFKGSNYLDAIANAGIVVFDKTGTLTTGQFAVTSTTGLTKSQIATVAAIEQDSPHPIARAIINYCQPDGPQPSDVKNIAGYGLSASVEDKEWLVGTTRLLKSKGIPYPDTLQEAIGTMVAVAVNGEYTGHFLLNDTPKDDAKRAITDLDRQGIQTVMLSGDKQAIADDSARQLGIKEAHGDLLPQDKAEHIGRLQEEGSKQVVFVGDGINDAPVLASSDVGIAMGALGSDMAIETADVIIQTDQPSRVAEAVTIGRRTRTIVKQNIAFAIGIKVLVMLLGVIGVANMWNAVFADVGVALLCVLNSLRLMRGNAAN